MASSRIITLEEVKKHKNKKSVWIVIHNNVYDVTKFLDDHPGGADSLLEVAGQDGTQAFEDVGHSDTAREMMTEYLVGSLPASERTRLIEKCCPGVPLLPKTSKKEKKTWRTFDGTTSRKSSPKSEYKPPTTPKVERRVQTIFVPKESYNWKWILLALATAALVGFVVKKRMAA